MMCCDHCGQELFRADLSGVGIFAEKGWVRLTFQCPRCSEKTIREKLEDGLPTWLRNGIEKKRKQVGGLGRVQIEQVKAQPISEDELLDFAQQLDGNNFVIPRA